MEIPRECLKCEVGKRLLTALQDVWSSDGMWRTFCLKQHKLEANYCVDLVKSELSIPSLVLLP